jgi:nicotinate-nucleotide adenylyltransferase
MDCKRKIGLMGGTFNPIHIAHLILAENAYREFDLDEVIFLPNHIPPHKRFAHIAPDEDRLAMVRLATAGIPYFSVSDMEMTREGYSYSSDTLLELRSKNPDCEYYFIMGGDSIEQFETWHRPDIILANCTVLAAAREEDGSEKMDHYIAALTEKYHADIRKMLVPRLDLSSSEIRQRIKDGKSVRFMLMQDVLDYIMEKKLYQNEE